MTWRILSIYTTIRNYSVQTRSLNMDNNVLRSTMDVFFVSTADPTGMQVSSDCCSSGYNNPPA